MQKVLLIVALIAFAGFASAASTEELKSLWTSWKTYHKKHYTIGEEAARFAIFVDNYYKVIAFNAENETPKLGLNRFADLTGSEWKTQYTGNAFVETNKNLIASKTKSYETVVDLPASVDWRDKGAVTPVKDQGQCGSCWSFSTTGVLEGFYFLNNGNLLSFSEQQIVDCDTDNYGCNGGWPYLAVEYAASNGLELESDYPYTAEDGNCAYDSSKKVSVAGGYSFVTANDTNSLKAALVDQPVSVLIEADQSVFQLYSSGVVWKNCGNSLDHAVLAVGYTKKSLLDTFIVKNSWATTWGDQGYIYISTNNKANDGTGVCGILSQPLIATN